MNNKNTDNKNVTEFKKYTDLEKVQYFTQQLHDIADNILEADNAYEILYWVRQMNYKGIRIEKILSKFPDSLPEQKNKKGG